MLFLQDEPEPSPEHSPGEKLSQEHVACLLATPEFKQYLQQRNISASHLQDTQSRLQLYQARHLMN